MQMVKTAYERALAEKLKVVQREQRAMTPERIGQKCLRDFCGRVDFGAVMSPDAARDFVRLVEAIVVAERAED